MPWEEKSVPASEKREKFVTEAMWGERSFSEICREYKISRRTGYKWLERGRNNETMEDKIRSQGTHPQKTSSATDLMHTAK